MGDLSDLSGAANKKKPKSQERVEQLSDEVEQDQNSNALFSCPVDGCTKVYHRQYSLEKHLSYGKREFLPSLKDKAKVFYHDKPLGEASALPSVKSVWYQHPKVTEVRPQGWTFRYSK